ncbi:acyl-CoA dehydrogenase family protein [Neisseria perflava]|uniref:acyl-CoA dehydrogenase family protein n=1 Tax=Neisseria perflava TaxID=33053 RepID=UPI00209EC38D|nr:acyl-CoA dehydrogenase family protein [Neisseria perflava]MCP1661231.1 alkylation response protein AidB-like acyl-CoA dehydrogenase [Neisseria perflava]MCP1773283.1 alkylation response protein AidB-like acyl-CoA dehydrogenase [Neisseria perflava]
MAHSESTAQPQTLDTAAFLQQIKAFLRRGAESGLTLMEYLPEDKWLELKKIGLLLPFLKEQYGGRKTSQFEIQEVLRLMGHYGVPVTLRTGIEGALVLQPLQEFGSEAQIKLGLDLIFNGEGGGLGVTEPETSGSAIAREMQSYYEYIDDNTIYINACKYWQGNSQADFLLVAAKERKNGKLSKVIDLLLVPKKYITYEVLQSEGLRAVRYAVNKIDTQMPSEAVMKLSAGDAAGSLRAFQNIFVRSRLQLVGMTHGIMEYIVYCLGKFVRSEVKFVDYERREIERRYAVSQVLYDFTCKHVSPDAPVSHQLMEANIIKTLATEYTYAAAQMLQKLLGAKGFERGHVASNIAIDFRPFTIFEGPNDMLYAEIYDQFARATAAEKEQGIKIEKTQSLLARLQSDVRFSAVALPERSLPQDIADFLAQRSLGDAEAVQKVFIGKILAKLFTFIQAESDDAAAFLLNDVRKDMLDCAYCV